MKEERSSHKLYVCLLFVIIISDGHATELCPELDGESILHQGLEYSYSLQAQVISELSATGDDRSVEVTMDCKILITHSHTCFYKLQMLNCSFASRYQNKQFDAVHDHQTLESISKYPVMFLVSNGVISHVYSDSSDPVFSVNIKRGVLSVFVFKLSSTVKEAKEEQTDIHGSCPLKFVPRNGESGRVDTYRDLSQCIAKGCTDSVIHGWSIISSKNFIKNFASSSVECQYKIDLLQKTMEEVLCKENHYVKMNFFQETSESTRASIYYKMKHLQTTKMAANARYELPMRKTDISFECVEFQHSNSDSSNFLASAERMLKDLIEISQNEMNLSGIRLFKAFVEWLRTSTNVMPFVESVLKCSDSSSFHEICSSPKKELAVAYLIDGLVECNTISCIEAISYLSIKNFLPDVYLNYILYSWSNMGRYPQTKLEIADYVMNICLKKNSKFCWLNLGILVKKCMIEQSSLSEIPTSLRKIASYYDDQVNSTCRSCASSVYFSSDKEQHDHLYTFVKAIGNMGASYFVLVPNGVVSLLTCFNSKSLPVFEKVAVLETLKKLNVCCNSEVCKVIHSKLFPVLAKESEEVELRMHIFELFMLCPEKYNPLPIVIKILKEYKNSQMKAFIASYLEAKLKDHNYVEENSQFIQELLYELQKHKIQLTNFYQGKEKKTSIFTHDGTFGIPFLHQEINKFGLKVDMLTIYRIYNMIPHFLRSDVAVHFFSKVANIAQFGVHFEGLSDIGRIFMKTLHDINEMKSHTLDFNSLISALFEMLSSMSSKKPAYEPNYHLDEVVINNIKKIHNIYKAYHSEASPFFRAYLDIFGDTLNFLSLDDIMDLIFGLMGYHELNIFDILHNGIVFNTSRIFRLINAQHQIPTMTGLPLTWSSDLTLAFSLHSKLKMGLNEDEKIKPLWGTDVFFQPSAALTFLNKASFGSPNIMLTGVLSNSSYYTSTHWKARHAFTGLSKTWKLDIEKPEVSQTFIQYSHQNEVIIHSSHEGIGDCDYKRSSEWCLNDEMNSILGLKVCQELFDPREAEERSPAKNSFGCYKWGMYVHPYDSKLKAYSFEMSMKNDSGRDETEIRFHTPDSTYKREVILSLSEDKKNMESSLNLRIPELPGFSASASSKNFLKKDGVFGCKVQAVLQLSKDSKYQFIYKNSASNGNFTGSPTYAAREFGNKISSPQLHESSLQLETPFNMYKLKKKTIIKDQSTHNSIVASYSNLISEWNWLSKILPMDFWETNSKEAWIQVDFDSTEHELQKDEVTSYHSSLGYIKSPHMFIQVSLTSLTGPGKEQMHFSLRRMNSESLEIVAFLNATYNFLNSGNDLSSEKEIRIFNLTIPQRSWSAEVEKSIVTSEGKTLYDVTLTQSTIISEDNTEHTNIVELWYNKERASNKFDVEEKKYRFKMDLTQQLLYDEHLIDDFHPDSKNFFVLMNKLTTFEIKLLYPYGEIQEQVACHGRYLTCAKQDLPRFHTQLDFTLFSSKFNLTLDSSSRYQSSKKSSKIFHKDIFTYEKTGAKAVYNLFAQYSKTGDCNDIIFSHNISSYFVDFSSNVTYQCKPDDPKLHVLLLNIDSSSAVWETLNSELRQIFEDVNHEYSEESMNYSTPLIVINVTADWRQAQNGYDHRKRAVFTSLWDKIPSLEINFKSMTDGHRVFQINFHDEKEFRMICKLQYLKEGHFHTEINYSDVEHNQEWISFISMDSSLQNTSDRTWVGEINRASLQNVVVFCKNAYLTAGEVMSSISSEPSHPLNQILKPMLDATLSEYWTSLKSKGEDAFNVMFLEMEKVVKSLKPLYFPVISVIFSSISEAKFVASYLSLAIKDPSETQWNFLSLLNYAVSRIHQYFPEELFHVDQDKITFKFTSSPILQMLMSYKVFPSADNLVSVHKKESQRQFYRKAPGSKVAFIYGHTHFYSFDGHLYEFFNKPECTFLLSHDIHQSAFSVAASADSIHLLFPAITISINSKNEIYVNGSKQQNSLPIETENEDVVVTREGEIVFVQSPLLHVMCDGKNSMCALESSVWNSNNILGILGNADGEAYNEYMLPDGKVANNVSVFASAYELTGHMECKTMDILVKLKEVHDIKKICSRVREGEESLTDNYCSMGKAFQATSEGTCEGDFNKNTDVPFLSKEESALCYLEGFSTKFSSNVGGMQNIKHIKHMLEIVLVVNEHLLMHDGNNFHVNIENILVALEKKFHSESYFDVRYSLVGFGGKGVHYMPSIHTVDCNIWVPYKVLVNRLLETLEFKGTSKLNPMIGIKYAAESLGYDTFGSKIFILFTDEDKQQIDKETLETSVKHLLKNGITLYVFITYPGIQKGGVFGIRSDGSLLPSSNTIDMKQLIMHNGYLAKTAFATGGVFFAHSGGSSSENYLEFAQEVWNKVKKEEVFCRHCKEVQGMWWNNYQECTIQNC